MSLSERQLFGCDYLNPDYSVQGKHLFSTRLCKPISPLPNSPFCSYKSDVPLKQIILYKHFQTVLSTVNYIKFISNS